jgi:hypothetical protein
MSLSKAKLAEDTPSEFVFLVDRGKALQGRKMLRVKSALLLWLHSLPSGCTFNIIGFGDHVLKLYNSSQPYFDGSLRQARNYIRDLEADSLGTTTLGVALQQAFHEPVADGRTKQLFVLLADDGLTERAEDVLPVVAGGAKAARVYSFALGPRANQALARRIAKVASGFYEYLPSDQFLEAAVVDRVVRSSGPSLTRVTIDWGIAGVTAQVPASLPCIFSDNRNLFVGFATVPLQALNSESQVCATVHGRVSVLVDGRMVASRDIEVASANTAVSRASEDGVLLASCRARAVAEAQWEMMLGGKSAQHLRGRLLKVCMIHCCCLFFTSL